MRENPDVKALREAAELGKKMAEETIISIKKALEEEWEGGTV
jgi:Holliday junction resolvasome RuvABC DNA-binding subunit